MLYRHREAFYQRASGKGINNSEHRQAVKILIRDAVLPKATVHEFIFRSHILPEMGLIAFWERVEFVRHGRC